MHVCCLWFLGLLFDIKFQHIYILKMNSTIHFHLTQTISETVDFSNVFKYVCTYQMLQSGQILGVCLIAYSRRTVLLKPVIVSLLCFLLPGVGAVRKIAAV